METWRCQTFWQDYLRDTTGHSIKQVGTQKKIYQNERKKVSATKRSPSQHKTKNRYNMKTNNKPIIEKINWPQYSRLRNIQQRNQSPKNSHKTAFSPTIQVLLSTSSGKMREWRKKTTYIGKKGRSQDKLTKTT